jgi:hypothetical protein
LCTSEGDVDATGNTLRRPDKWLNSLQNFYEEKAACAMLCNQALSVMQTNIAPSFASFKVLARCFAERNLRDAPGMVAFTLRNSFWQNEPKVPPL